jgi:hypothetical protein
MQPAAVVGVDYHDIVHGVRAALSRSLLILCGAASLWALALTLTGGFVLHVGPFPEFASHRPRNPSLIALVSGLAACVLSTADERRSFKRAITTCVERSVPAPVLLFLRQPPAQVAPLSAAIVAVAVVTAGLVRGAFVAGGSDVYGYVSQAHLWATGRLSIEQPFVHEVPWPFAADALTPLGYRPAPHRAAAIVPAYSPGLPMVMAVFERVGGRDGVFYVVPVLGGLAVWATYLMGASLAGRTVGLSAAVLLATSPTFLIQLVIPMSDVPATAWWALALALLLSERRSAALASGLAVGAAILTRPNLVPLAVLPGGLLAWRAGRERSFTGLAAQRTLLFAAGAIPACVIVAIINARLYGSPLSSGYGSLRDLYGWTNLLPNLARYPRWLLETQTAVVLLALIAPFAVKARDPHGNRGFEPRAVAVTWMLFVVVVFISYFFYLQFDAWFWLRFMLPAFPPLFALTAIGIVTLLTPLRRQLRLVVTATVIGGLAWHGVTCARDRGVFDIKENERRTVALCEYIASALPSRAAFLSMQHSGSIRYYAQRLTVRYDWIPQDRLEDVISDLRHLGYYPYIVLEDWEEAQFRARFQGRNALAALDWPPVARVDNTIRIRIYDPADAQVPPASRLVTSEIIR